MTPRHAVIATALTLAIAMAWCSGALASTNPLAGSANHAPPPTGAARYVPGQVLVKFRDGTTSQVRARALNLRGGHTIRSLPIKGVRLVSVPKSEDVQHAAAGFQADPAVAWAQPDSYQQGAALPNDALFHEQWALSNGGQAVDGVAGTAGDDIHASEAWDRTTGSPAVRIAVVDSGINFNQPDLGPNIATNPGETGNGREHNGIDDDHNGFVDDFEGWDFVQDDNSPSDNNGHGTHVAGIIGARGNNGIGVAGVDWNTSIVPVRVLSNLNSGTCSDIGAGLAYAALAGARVVNVSIRGYSPCQAEEDAIAAAPNTLFVAIAGNESLDTGANPSVPCTFPEQNIICVAATDQNDQLADFSNYGAGVDLAAPGVGIKSTYVKWQPRQTFDQDSFEGPLTGRWVTGGSPNTWDRTIQSPLTGVFSLTDSPFANYPNNSYNYAARALDLTNERDCAVHASVRTALGAGDYLLGEVLPDGVNDAEVTGLTGTSSGYQDEYFDIGPLEGRSGGTFRFSLLSDGAGVGDGANVDDYSIVCVPPDPDNTGANDEFEFDYGTSMAAPYVTGVAGLVLSLDPSMSAVQVKDRILSSVDPIAGLAGKVASGGRLDAAHAVDLPTTVSPDPPPAAGGQSPGSHAKAASLASNLAAIRKALRRQGLRKLLRKGAVTVSVHSFAAGRFTFTLRARKRPATLAKGSHSTSGPGRVALKIRVTGPGGRILRTVKRLQVTLTLRFTPSAGAGTSRSAKVMLR